MRPETEEMCVSAAHEQIKVYVLKEGMKDPFLKFCKDGLLDAGIRRYVEGEAAEGVCKWLIKGKMKKADFWVCEQESEEGNYGKPVTLIVAAVGKSDSYYHDWYKIPGIKDFLMGGHLKDPYLKVESRPELQIQEGIFRRLFSYIGWQIRRIIPAA